MITNYLTEGPVSNKMIGQFIEKISHMELSGGHSFFIGQVRADEIGGKKVKSIEYSAYEGMVKIEADNIRKAVMSEFSDVTALDMVHSTGTVKAGEISLFVMVSAGHRNHAINGCSRAVELIKEKLPVWKKEIYDDDTHNWKQNTSG
jgi:molybdopterin synthase catalytic subunit